MLVRIFSLILFFRFFICLLVRDGMFSLMEDMFLFRYLGIILNINYDEVLIICETDNLLLFI